MVEETGSVKVSASLSTGSGIIDSAGVVHPSWQAK